MWWPSTILGLVFFYLSYKSAELRRFFFVMGCINLALGYWIGTL